MLAEGATRGFVSCRARHPPSLQTHQPAPKGNKRFANGGNTRQASNSEYGCGKGPWGNRGNERVVNGECCMGVSKCSEQNEDDWEVEGRFKVQKCSLTPRDRLNLNPPVQSGFLDLAAKAKNTASNAVLLVVWTGRTDGFEVDLACRGTFFRCPWGPLQGRISPKAGALSQKGAGQAPSPLPLLHPRPAPPAPSSPPAPSYDLPHPLHGCRMD